jgi:EAL domain-containing protein (putative c-di-GMP-specific phosphodiesterase class I)
VAREGVRPEYLRQRLRTFITGLTLSSEAHALTHTLIQLGKTLGLQTLAEGVEQHSQIRALQLEGCDLAQGFLFARPLAPGALERFLLENPVPAGALLHPARL